MNGGSFDELDGVEEEPLPPLEEPSQSTWGRYHDTSDAGWAQQGRYADPLAAEGCSIRRDGDALQLVSYEYAEDPSRSVRRDGENSSSYYSDASYQNYSQPWRYPYAPSASSPCSSSSAYYAHDPFSAGNEGWRRQTDPFEEHDPWASDVSSEWRAARSSWPDRSDGWSSRWRDGSWWTSSGEWLSVNVEASEGCSNNKDKDDDPPKWNGKSPSLNHYLRQIAIWLAATRVDPLRRGVKFLAQLEGDAFEKMSLVEPLSLKCRDGVDKLIALILQSYEPLENCRVGRIMDQFMYDFCRMPDEEIMDCNTRFDRELAEVEKVAGKLAPTWKAHLYLKKMRLREDKDS